MITPVIILFMIYASLEGEREADYFHFRWKHADEKIKDEHLRFTLQRALVALLSTGCACLQWGWFGLLLLPLIALIFPFFHDGAYYMKRHILDETVYKKGWSDNTTSSTAKISITPKLRLGLMIIGSILSIAADILLFVFL